jgi:hypothetical protein
MVPGEQGFKTRAVRELEALQKARVYVECLIRVQLPDRSIVQATFSPLVREDSMGGSGGRGEGVACASHRRCWRRGPSHCR